MEMKKKRILIAVSLLLCVVMVYTCIPGTVVQAKTKSSVTVYELYGVTTFSKKNGKLTVKAAEPFSKFILGKDNYTKTKKKKLSYSLAKNCKWTACVGSEVKKNSYNQIKRDLRGDYEYYLEYGEFDGPTMVQIFVKNKKIIEVREIPT